MFPLQRPLPSHEIAASTTPSSAEIERVYPHAAVLIARGSMTFTARADLNGYAAQLGNHRSGSFNGLHTYRYAHAERAAALADYFLDKRLHRLKPNSLDSASREEVADEWHRLADEREQILAWARTNNMFRDVVQEYRFERRRGAYSSTAHQAAARVIEGQHPEVADPLNHAGVLIAWAEREHRAWFWRCCRDHHVL